MWGIYGGARASPGTLATSDPTARPHHKLHQIHPQDLSDPFAIIVVEPLDRSETSDTKSGHMTRALTSPSEGDGGNLRRSSVDYVQMNELEEYRSLEDNHE
jgi:hypothetical protein